MTQINLPNRNVTGSNLWSQVEDNDDAIADVVNGGLDNGNIATGADINGSKLLSASVDTDQLAPDAVTSAKIEANAVNTSEIAAGAVTSPKLNLTIQSDTPTSGTTFSASTGGSNVTGLALELVAGTYLLVAQVGIVQLSTGNPAIVYLYNQTDSTQIGSYASTAAPSANKTDAVPLISTLTLAATKTIGVRIAVGLAGSATNLTVTAEETNLVAIRLG